MSEDTTSEEEATKMLIELTKLRESLIYQVKATKTEILSRERMSTTVVDETHEDIQSKLNVVASDVLKVKSNIKCRDNLLKMAAFSQEIMKSLHKEKFGVSSVLRMSVVEKLEKLNEISQNSLDKLEGLNGLERNYEDAKLRLKQAMIKNRELSVLLEHAENNCDVTMKQKNVENENSKIRSEKNKLEKVLDETKLRRSCFQALIGASQVDWFNDPELKEIVISLGEPVLL
ncbi:uncharacterized protein LOC104266471 [Ciona intestinalis]